MHASQIPFDHHGISGAISVKLRDSKTLEDLCLDVIPGYDPQRFEAVALRLFCGKETIMTIYALDKSHKDPDQKLPVKKFKLEHLTLEKLAQYCSEFNLTVTTGNYPLQDMEVINK